MLAAEPSGPLRPHREVTPRRRFSVRVSVPSLRLFAGIAIVAMSALACSSSTELEAISTQLAEVERRLLELQKESPSGEDVERVSARVDEGVETILLRQAELAQEVDRLGREIEELHTDLDDTNFRLAQLSQQIAATHQELQAIRFAAEEAQRDRVAAPQTPDPGDPGALYETAYNDYVSGNFDLAILGFRQYLESFPEHEQADNAAYWLGESYYRQSRYKKAIEQFDRVLDRYDSSDRAASSLLKKAYAYLELGQRAQGIVQLQKVACEHDGTDEAVLARNRLRQLGIDAEC